MTFLQISKLSKRYGSKTIVQDVELSVRARETLSILGKSGCGKTTMLKIIAGLTLADTGDIEVDGRSVIDQTPQDRNIVYLYQDDLLFPHLSARDNIAFGLRLRKVAPDAMRSAVDTMIAHLELDGHADKMPHELSGGQRQRVSFGRAMIIRPRLLLLDEPFGSLDSGTRAAMQRLFKQLAQVYQITSLFVTHDLKEAILMGDQIAYMANGKLTIYPSIEAFVTAAESGVQAEVDFWTKLQNS